MRGIEIVRIAKTAGFDSIYVDLEHSSLSVDATGQICMAALEAGIAPFVRVPANTAENIQRALDGGALGVIAPNVRSAEEARAVVAAVKYPPLGQRGASGGLPHLQYRSFPAAEANAARRCGHHGHRPVRERGGRRQGRGDRRASRASTWC